MAKKAKQKGNRMKQIFRGPESDALPKLNDGQTVELVTGFRTVLSCHDCLRFHRKKDEVDDSQPDQGKVVHETKNELIFGLNEILKSIRKKTSVGVVISDPLTIHMQRIIADSCQLNEIPVVFVHNFGELKVDFNLSCLTGLAFNSTSANLDSMFYQPFSLFSKIAQQFSFNQFESHKHPEVETIEIVSLPEKEPLSKFTFKFPSSDELYVKKVDETYEKPVRDCKVENDGKIPLLDEFIQLKSLNDEYFPVSCFVEDKLNICVNVQESETRIEDESFANSLLIDTIKPAKRKRNKPKESQSQSISKFKKAKVIQVDVSSTTRSLNKKKKKVKVQNKK